MFLNRALSKLPEVRKPSVPYGPTVQNLKNPIFRPFGSLTAANWGSFDFKGGPEPSNFEDLCLVNISVKYFSKLCFGTIKIQPELKYLKTILEDRVVRVPYPTKVPYRKVP